MFITKTCPITITALLVSFTVIVCKAQSHSSQATVDTLGYLQKNITQKRFVHQPLDSLLTSLKLPIRSYTIINWQPSRSEPVYLVLFFETEQEWQERTDRRERLCYITVGFETEPSKTTALELRSNNYGAWLNAEQSYYGKLKLRIVEVGKMR